jgi:hypothetical protein
MKISNLLFLLCFGIKLSVAQSRPVIKLNQGNKDTIPEQIFPKGAMPNALQKNDPSLQSKLKGNNKNGFDIYESNLDRMTILIPDSVNKASLGISSPKQNQTQRLKLKNNPPSQQYQDIPLTRPLDDSLLIPDFNMKPFDSNKKKRKN